MDLNNYLTIKQIIEIYDIAESTVRMAAKNNEKTQRFSNDELVKLGRDWLVLKDAAEREWGNRRKIEKHQ